MRLVHGEEGDGYVGQQRGEVLTRGAGRDIEQIQRPPAQQVDGAAPILVSAGQWRRAGQGFGGAHLVLHQGDRRLMTMTVPGSSSAGIDRSAICRPWWA
jgi:hypothetical protein